MSNDMTTHKLFGGNQYPVEDVTVDGVRWTVDTNGHAIIVTWATDESHPPMPNGLRRDVATSAIRFEFASDAAATNVDALHEFLGPAEFEKEADCPNCKATGIQNHHCGCALCQIDEETCRDCDGEKRVTFIPEARAVRFGETMPVNANLVACALVVANAQGHCYVGRHDHNSIAIMGNGWRIVIMGYNEPPKLTTPVFPCETIVSQAAPVPS